MFETILWMKISKSSMHDYNKTCEMKANFYFRLSQVNIKLKLQHTTDQLFK